mmetsp:Transcript_62864/g.158721  ORF Transcript_62864/g.158721 Transcript_62864/m.158721 type:complete len:156 (-) Transcript_62864:234-701(-)
MVSCDVGTFTSSVCFIASLCTLLAGILYIILRLEHMHVHFEHCGFLQEDCNKWWRKLFTLRPNYLFDVWTPLIIGILGSSIHIQSLRFASFFESLLPQNYVQYAFFMLLTALFANFGYCGQFGVLVGALSTLGFLLCVIARFMGEGGVKILQTKY